MCKNACRHLWGACEECIEDALLAHESENEHRAVLAHVPASDDEWRRRLGELYPLTTELETELQTQRN